jgi:hypothetical protein
MSRQSEALNNPDDRYMTAFWNGEEVTQEELARRLQETNLVPLPEVADVMVNEDTLKIQALLEAQDEVISGRYEPGTVFALGDNEYRVMGKDD